MLLSDVFEKEFQCFVFLVIILFLELNTLNYYKILNGGKVVI